MSSLRVTFQDGQEIELTDVISDFTFDGHCLKASIRHEHVQVIEDLQKRTHASGEPFVLGTWTKVHHRQETQLGVCWYCDAAHYEKFEFKS